MGVTVAFCDRFKVEDLGLVERRHGLEGDTLRFEYVTSGSQRLRGRQGSEFAHVGEAVKEFLDGQRFRKQAEGLLGLAKRPVDVELSSWAPAKGDTIAVLVSLRPRRGGWEAISRFFRKDAPPDPQVRVVYDGREVPAFPTASDNTLLRALVPTTPLTTPGPRTLQVKVRDGQYAGFEGVVEVTEKEYPVESIWLPKTKSKLRGTVMEKERIGALIGTLSAEQIWSGPFLLPSDGEVTTGYGLQRYYNGVFADQYYHRGVDYGAWEGEPVKAPANGRVVLVGEEKAGYEIHGNCVGLDHGQGVTSIMMHLHSSFVKEGEMVRAGQIIGTVGETGIATGPHLHWGLHVRGEAVDPQPWMHEQKWL